MIETARLLLRPFVGGDLDALADMYADAESMRFIGGVRTREQTREELGWWIAGEELSPAGYFGPRAVVTRDGRLIGRAGLWLQDIEGVREAEVGYLIARAEWGKGYATEAARAVRDAGLAAGWPRLISLIDPANVASQRVALKNGMHHERDILWHDTPHRIYALHSAPARTLG